MMLLMATACGECGGERAYVRARYEARLLGCQLIMEEVPSVRCEACDLKEPAPHVRPQFDAVVALAEDVSGARMTKSFASLPLHPDDDVEQ